MNLVSTVEHCDCSHALGSRHQILYFLVENISVTKVIVTPGDDLCQSSQQKAGKRDYETEKKTYRDSEASVKKMSMLPYKLIRGKNILFGEVIT